MTEKRYTEDPERKRQDDHAVEVLRSAGSGAGNIDDAVEGGADELALVAARHLTFPGSRQLRPADVWERAGVGEATARSLWRAMGFPDVPDDDRAFTDADVEALRVAVHLFDQVDMSETVMLQQARVMSQAVARIAESHQDVIAAILGRPDPAGAAAESLVVAGDALPALDHILTYMYRRHLAAATEQRLLMGTEAGRGAINLSVGFADMTGFTEVSAALSAEELADTIEHFNAATADVIAQRGGRVVKTIGDEVMFTTSDPARGAEVAVALLDAVSLDRGTPQLRVGLATGPVLAREGDVFGTPVNLASRLVTIARPDSALVDRTSRDALVDDDRFELSTLAARRLKGLGRVGAYRLRAART
jgi:adenylate cyclase